MECLMVFLLTIVECALTSPVMSLVHAMAVTV